MMTETLTRKEIAQMTELSVDVIRRNEKQLGIDDAKIVINGRMIRYKRAKVIKALLKMGYEAHLYADPAR